MKLLRIDANMKYKMNAAQHLYYVCLPLGMSSCMAPASVAGS